MPTTTGSMDVNRMKKKNHYEILLKRRWPGGTVGYVSVYRGTNLPKMADAYDLVRRRLDGWFELKLDIDENYDPDLGAFSTYESIFNEPSSPGPSLAFDNVMCEVRKLFGETAD